MEKLPGGGCVFRTGKAEEKTQQVFQGKQQESMEKLYRQIEEEVEKEEKEGTIGLCYLLPKPFRQTSGVARTLKSYPHQRETTGSSIDTL